MRNPFQISGPAMILFSGGRSSAYMLSQIVRAHGGVLPDDVKVSFSNTGKEREECLAFVRDCGEHFGVEIVWLEYCDDDNPQRRVRQVTYKTASRDGEPFKALIARKQFLPNPATRFCTIELKIRTVKLYCQSILGWTHWENALGLRADEPSRLAKIRGGAHQDVWENIMPLASAGITRGDVAAYWRQQNFDLALPNINNATPHGNCDLCFLKSARLTSALMREDPERATWWITAEKQSRASKPSGARFRNDRPSYAELLAAVQNQTPFDFGDSDQLNDCICGT